MKKHLLLIISALFAISVSAADLNPFAYALSSTLNADKTVLTVNYSLNAKASEVNVVVLAGETVLKTIACEGLTKGAHSVEVPTADFPTEEAITWRVDVKGAEVKDVTLVDNSVKMYAPTSVDIDNNPENENFGTVFVVEGLPTAKDNATYANYISYTDGAGLYVLNADGTARRMPNQGDKVRYGYNGGRVSQTRQYFNGNSSSAYSPYRVRVSEDGRIFVSSLSPDGQVLWEADPLVFSRPNATDWQERAVAGWTHVMSDKNDNTVMATEKRNCTHTYCGIYGLFEGNAATGTFIAGPNIGFDVRGAGKDLKLLMLSGCKQAIVSFTPAHFYCDEYDLGEATMWNTAPSRRIFKGNVVNHVGTQVQYDEDGNVWMCQYRQGTDYPTLMKFNAASTDEVLYNEDPRQPYHRCGAIRFNNDYTQVAIATVGSGTGGAFTVYPVVDGMPVWNQGTEVDCKSVTHQSLMDFAWDYAGNLYIAADAASGTAGHCVAIYAMPHAADKVVSTPAAKKYAFSVECQSGATYTVKTICDPEEGGTISCQLGGNARVAGVLTNIPSCTELTVTATPDPGYQFLGWEDDLHNTVSTNPVYTFFVTRDITLKAKFKYATYNVTWWNLFKDGEDIVSNTHDSKRNARLWYLFMPYYNVDGSDKDRDIKPNVGDNKDEYNVLNFGYTATKDILLGTKMEWLGKYLSKVEGNLSNSNSYSDWRACLYPFINRVGYVRSADGTKITSGYWDINYENIKKFANGAADPKAWRPFWCQEACDLDSLIMFSDNMPIDWNQIVGPSQEYDTYTTTLPTSGIPTKTPKWYQWNTAPKANQLLAWREGGTDPMNNRIVHHVDKSMALYATYVDKKLQEDDPAPSGEHDASNDDVLRLLANPNYGSTEHNISVDRSLVGGMYNTICLPFDVYQNNLPAFLNGADIKKFSGVEQKYEESGDPVVVLNFVDVQPTADGILLEAGKPYLVNPKKDVPAASMIYQGVKWWNVLIDKGPYIETGGSSSVEFHGVFNPTSLRVGDYILVADSRLAKVTDTAEKLKGFRGYFKINDEELQSVAEEGRLYLSMKKPTTTSIPLAPEAEKPVQPKVRKVMHDGKIYILRGDEVYTVTGHRVR